MSVLVASVAAYTVVLTLLIACGEHLSKPSVLAMALSAHRILPAPPVVAAVVVASEGLLGGAGLVALLRGDDRLLTVVLAGSAVLLVAYAGYGWQVTRSGRTVPCGCSRAESPMTGWVVGRAAVLAGLALLGSLSSKLVAPLARPDGTLPIVLLAAVAFAVLLAHLPAAMHDPAHESPVPALRGGRPE